MNLTHRLARAISFEGLLCAAAPATQGAVSPDEAKRLGQALTPIGA